jgi:hypothetical protein
MYQEKGDPLLEESSGDADMTGQSRGGRRHRLRPIENGHARRTVNRRGWLRLAGIASVGFGGLARRPIAAMGADEPKTAPGETAEEEIRRAVAIVRKATDHEVRTVRSAHYQAIGDASETFTKLTLSDCEQVALDYLKHYRDKGFDVKLPDRRLILIVFADERPFLKYAGRVPRGLAGFYSQRTNWLALFDFRNAPMITVAAGQDNRETVTHEATHQLNFNSGVLERSGDAPHSISEGLAMYGERRKLHGPSEPGQINQRRLIELAHSQRRVEWIPVANLIAEKPNWYGGQAAQRTLGYAESWLLVYHLMTDPVRLPQFRAYLQTLRGRKDQLHRRDDARSHFGDLEQLDQELRQASVKLLRAP